MTIFAVLEKALSPKVLSLDGPTVRVREEGRIVGRFGADVDRGVVSVAVDVQVEVADDVTEGEEVADEQKGAED